MPMLRLLLTVIVLTSLLTGCLYANITTPYDTDLDQTSLGTKTGESSIHSILWLLAFGDAGTAAAAREGNIKIINHLDRKSLVVLFGLYSRTTTIAYGE